MKKILAVIAIVVIVAAIAIGSTIAYLADTSEKIENTFTVGNVRVALEETEGYNATDETYTFKMVPGAEIEKDPVAIVKGGSEDCYLFVEIEESSVLARYITYVVADGWAKVNGTTNIYGMIVTANAADQSFAVLKDNKVSVLQTVTQEMMDALGAPGATQPSLTFTAYAIQQDGFATDAAAWTALQAQLNPTP